MKDDNPTIAFWSTVAVCRLDPKPESVAAVAGYLDHRDPELAPRSSGGARRTSGEGRVGRPPPDGRSRG